MVLGRTSKIAIRALLYLALQPPGRLTTVHQIARGARLREPSLAKIIQHLIRAGLLQAFRGPGGGVELGRPAEAITLSSVVGAMEGPAPPERCLLSLRICSGANSCPLHARWSVVRAQTERLLEETTLSSLVQGLNGSVERGPEFWPEVFVDDGLSH